jgi:hypothetical protein
VIVDMNELRGGNGSRKYGCRQIITDPVMNKCAIQFWKRLYSWAFQELKHALFEVLLSNIAKPDPIASSL